MKKETHEERTHICSVKDRTHFSLFLLLLIDPMWYFLDKEMSHAFPNLSIWTPTGSSRMSKFWHCLRLESDLTDTVTGQNWSLWPTDREWGSHDLLLGFEWCVRTTQISGRVEDILSNRCRHAQVASWGKRHGASIPPPVVSSTAPLCGQLSALCVLCRLRPMSDQIPVCW